MGGQFVEELRFVSESRPAPRLAGQIIFAICWTLVISCPLLIRRTPVKLVKTAATAHAQTCQNMSGYDLSNVYEETESKHVSRPPEARSKVFATATAHAQTCQNMSGYDLSNIYEETEIKHVSRPPEARAHAQTCQNMSGYDLSNIYEEKESKQVSRPPEGRSKVCNSNSACSNMPKHVRIRPVKHIQGNRNQTCQ